MMLTTRPFFDTIIEIEIDTQNLALGGHSLELRVRDQKQEVSYFEHDAFTLSLCELPNNIASIAGDTIICPDNAHYFSVQRDNRAVNHAWQLWPVAAGKLAYEDTVAYLDWNSKYTGAATLTVAGINECGFAGGQAAIHLQGLDSIDFSQPPMGNKYICSADSAYMYTVTGNANITSYSWKHSPANALTISGNGNTGQLDWNNAYQGNAQIWVEAFDRCNRLHITPVKEISSVVGTPDLPTGPTGENFICNSDSTLYFASQNMFTSYLTWSVEPVNAGELIAKDTLCTLLWNKDLRARHNCG
ncbi:MAG: hypothetical protein HC896_14375 [Bacteroidales bacterium]|nr:hypothetical protein [Bacteroidales bacterium]